VRFCRLDEDKRMLLPPGGFLFIKTKRYGLKTASVLQHRCAIV
jgi:hypothetical protein